MVTYFPRYFSKRAMSLYVMVLVLSGLIFGYPMKWYWWAFGIVEVIGFFFFSSQLSKAWANISDKQFIISIFELSLIIRSIFVVFSYFFYIDANGSFFEFGAADSYTYHMFAERGAQMIERGEFNFKEQFDGMGFFSRGVDIADMGYPILLSFLYLITNDSIVIARLVKAILSAFTVVLVYKTAKRNFSTPVARMTAIFCALMPNLIYYCGTHLKETEMLFLTAFFIERADAVLRGKINIWQLVPVVLIGIGVYFFRAVLAVVLFLAFFTALLLSSNKVVSRMKKYFLGALSIILLGAVFANRISENIDLADYTKVQAQQDQNMQWRADREGGNSFASMASAAVFAPLIFTIPFPTLVDIPYQETQQMLNGGNFAKNITSFFTVLALIILLLSGKWRERVLPIAFMCGYLLVLAFSNYAQSERFHIPILPYSLMFAAYGISQMTNERKNWYTYWLAFLFVADLGWQWFKLRGRGM